MLLVIWRRQCQHIQNGACSTAILTGWVLLSFVREVCDSWDMTYLCVHSVLQSSLRSLAEDFSAMVNNPHLSDVQFQMDSGEVLYAHMFVLYARCPQAIQAVSTADTLSYSALVKPRLPTPRVSAAGPACGHAGRFPHLRKAES